MRAAIGGVASRAAIALLLVLRPFGAGAESLAEATGTSAARIAWPVVGGAEKASAAHPKLDPSLAALVEEVREKGLALLDEREQDPDRELVLRDRAVAVALAAEGEADREALQAKIEAVGGRVTADVADILFARVPVAALAELGEAPEATYVAPQSRLRPFDLAKAGGVTSEGIAAARVAALHEKGIRGAGTKIGIIDFGFARYDELVAAGEVPRPVAARAFAASGRMGDEAEVHGTACAEIIHDVAPEAQLYLAGIDGADDEVIRAARWLAGEGVQVISFSGGGHVGPHDGTAPLDRLVAELTERHGILWVNAAGNEGASHWMGQTVDRDGDGGIDISDGGDVIAFESRGGFRVIAVWADWGPDPSRPAATIDVDLGVFRFEGRDRKPTLVARSVNPQAGRGRPVEIAQQATPPGIYLAYLRATRVGRAVPIHVFIDGAVQMAPTAARGSVAIPATGRASLAVGAVHVDDAKLAFYSGQGPTDDARIKPDVSAPSNTTSAAYQRGERRARFTGTSAAAPHASGFAALVRQASPGIRIAELRERVVAAVDPRGAGIPNNQYGFGHIDGARVKVADATVSPAPPPPGEPSPPPPAGGETSEANLDRILQILDESGAPKDAPESE
jgi:subtilisin family serine protease